MRIHWQKCTHSGKWKTCSASKDEESRAYRCCSVSHPGSRGCAFGIDGNPYALFKVKAMQCVVYWGPAGEDLITPRIEQILHCHHCTVSKLRNYKLTKAVPRQVFTTKDVCLPLNEWNAVTASSQRLQPLLIDNITHIWPLNGENLPGELTMLTFMHVTHCDITHHICDWDCSQWSHIGMIAIPVLYKIARCKQRHFLHGKRTISLVSAKAQWESDMACISSDDLPWECSCSPDWWEQLLYILAAVGGHLQSESGLFTIICEADTNPRNWSVHNHMRGWHKSQKEHAFMPHKLTSLQLIKQLGCNAIGVHMLGWTSRTKIYC